MSGHRPWSEISKAVRSRPGAEQRIEQMKKEICSMNIAPAEPHGEIVTTRTDSYGDPMYEREIYVGRLENGTRERVVIYRAIGPNATIIGSDHLAEHSVFCGGHEEAKRVVDGWADYLLNGMSKTRRLAA